MSDNDEIPTTVIIRRPARVATDDRGRTIWVGDIEETELELMSSGELHIALAAVDDMERETIRHLANSDEQGVVVRDRKTGALGVVSDAELEQLVDQNDKLLTIAHRLGETVVSTNDDAATELSLVSTQALRTLLNPDEPEPESAKPDEERGFDPYDRS